MVAVLLLLNAMDEKRKKRAAKHIIYEIQMFAFTYKKIYEKGLDPLTRNAIIESFLIHAYNLFRFLYQGETEHKNGRSVNRNITDMIAEDYIERKAYFRRNRSPKKLFKTLEKKRNKQLAHLTYDRTKMRGWSIKKIFDGLWITVDVFLVALPEKINKKWFAATIIKARQRQTEVI